jgi:hypothetical protein
VKQTLEIFLRSLPEGTLFNIIGFGTNFEKLFTEGSLEYNDKTLETASNHVKKMFADLGGILFTFLSFYILFHFITSFEFIYLLCN